MTFFTWNAIIFIIYIITAKYKADWPSGAVGKSEILANLAHCPACMYLPTFWFLLYFINIPSTLGQGDGFYTLQYSHEISLHFLWDRQQKNNHVNLAWKISMKVMIMEDQIMKVYQVTNIQKIEHNCIWIMLVFQ